MSTPCSNIYVSVQMVGPRGIEPLPSVSKTEMISISPRTDINNVMNTYCVETTLNIPLLKNNTLLKINFPNYHNKLNPALFVNEDFTAFLLTKDLHILHFELFYARPYLIGGIHTDIAPCDFAKLNYVYGGKDSTMNWFKQKVEGTKAISISDVGTEYQFYAPDEVDLVYSHKLKDKPSIVQVGSPHNIENFSEPRHCFSCVIGYKFGQSFERLTMQQAIDLLS